MSTVDFADLNKDGAMPEDILDLAEDDNGTPSQGKRKGGQSKGPSQAEVLLSLADGAELFHDAEQEPYADVVEKGVRKTLPVKHGLRSWLAGAYYRATRGAPASEVMLGTLAVLEARAVFDSPERTVYLRVSPLDDRVFIDLGDDTWRAIEVDAEGWRIVANPPVRFRRPKGTQALPVPEHGAIGLLRPFVNVVSEGEFTLLVAWLLAAIRGKGPFPLLVLIGEQGTAKSTLTKILRALIDAFRCAERPLPKEDRDLAIAAHNSYVLAFGNLSNVATWQSDALCRLSTGGGFTTRQLFADTGQTIFDATRPILLNGIDEFVTRADLADRALVMHLEPIPDEQRRPESELWAEFEAVRPRIMGALLDAVATGLRNFPTLKPVKKLPRMADFAQWARACEPALWPEGTFLEAYGCSRSGLVDATLEGDPVAEGVRQLASEPGGWSGTATALLKKLAPPLGDLHTARLPKSPKALGDKLRRLATFLRAVGVHVETGEREGKARTRMIRLWAEPDDLGTTSSAASASSASPSD